ncbi:MAG: sigma-70 family RNA polymerase sigma factor [Actinomycetales bacterium]|uniref:RNA polymerase sigma factor n=1 Tax=Candidatus Phosphoribacter hodrii TaxID=2953743 RepID=A0A935INL3_9MICO|nr:sigma-70 family RNA polymerase sigma factor [Candidatus Phosphoribacter hodrii]
MKLNVGTTDRKIRIAIAIVAAILASRSPRGDRTAYRCRMGITHEEITAAVPGLLRYARVLTRDAATAEDLVQDTVVRALERAADFRGDSSAATWLHRILHHRFVDVVRASRPTPSMPKNSAERVEADWRDDSYTVDAETVLLRAETAEELRDAIIHLPAAYRSAVVLHDVQGLTSAAVADIQDVSLAAAKQRISRARAMLVTHLARGTERRAALGGIPLRCWDARSRVSDYLDGDLDSATRVALETHLGSAPRAPPCMPVSSACAPHSVPCATPTRSSPRPSPHGCGRPNRPASQRMSQRIPGQARR